MWALLKILRFLEILKEKLRMYETEKLQFHEIL